MVTIVFKLVLDGRILNTCNVFCLFCFFLFKLLSDDFQCRMNLLTLPSYWISCIIIYISKFLFISVHLSFYLEYGVDISNSIMVNCLFIKDVYITVCLCFSTKSSRYSG